MHDCQRVWVEWGDLEKRFVQSGGFTLGKVPVLRFESGGMTEWLVCAGKGY